MYFARKYLPTTNVVLSKDRKNTVLLQSKALFFCLKCFCFRGEIMNEISENNTEIIRYAPVRVAALRILNRFERSDSYLEKLLAAEMLDLSGEDAKLLVEIVHGILRWQARLDWILNGFYRGEFDRCLTPVKNAMRIALYQILFLKHIDPLEAVAASTAAIARIKGEQPAGIVHNVLRNILRNVNSIRYPPYEDDVYWYYAVMYSHPRWLVKRWVERFGEAEAALLLKANNRHTAALLRPNMRRTSLDELQQQIENSNVAVAPSKLCEGLLTISNFMPAQPLEGYEQGLFDILDPASALSIRFAARFENCSIIALGTRSGNVALALAENNNALLIDTFRDKLNPIMRAAKRLGVRLDTAEYNSYSHLPEMEAELVVFHAPCSELGALADRPGMKWKRNADDITVFARKQQNYIEQSASLVKLGGTLQYITRSFEPEETFETITRFLERRPDFRLEPAEYHLPSSVCTDGFLYILPQRYGTGVFGAQLIRCE